MSGKGCMIMGEKIRIVSVTELIRDAAYTHSECDSLSKVLDRGSE